eukprot:scaffold164487_cov29-Tisochrysis_lutea.AAC.1
MLLGVNSPQHGIGRPPHSRNPAANCQLAEQADARRKPSRPPPDPSTPLDPFPLLHTCSTVVGRTPATRKRPAARREAPSSDSGGGVPSGRLAERAAAGRAAQVLDLLSVDDQDAVARTCRPLNDQLDKRQGRAAKGELHPVRYLHSA